MTEGRSAGKPERRRSKLSFLFLVERMGSVLSQLFGPGVGSGQLQRPWTRGQRIAGSYAAYFSAYNGTTLYSFMTDKNVCEQPVYCRCTGFVQQSQTCDH